jgi:hypothetical protein
MADMDVGLSDNRSSLADGNAPKTDMYKVVVNGDYGGWGLSKKAIDWLVKHGSKHLRFSPQGRGFWEGSRHDPLLVERVETLGKAASGELSKIIVVEIATPLYRVDEYDGFETVETPEDIEWTDAREAWPEYDEDEED